MQYIIYISKDNSLADVYRTVYHTILNINANLESLIIKWLGRVSQGHEMHCHDLEVMSSNPGRVELGMRSRLLLPEQHLI